MQNKFIRRKHAQSFWFWSNMADVTDAILDSSTSEGAWARVSICVSSSGSRSHKGIQVDKIATYDK